LTGAVEREVVDIFGERWFGDRHLVFDRARLLLGDLGFEQIADKALWLELAFDRCCEQLVIGVPHAVDLEFAHHVESFGSFHDHAFLSWSYLAQSAMGVCRTRKAWGVRIVTAGPGSRFRARMLRRSRRTSEHLPYGLRAGGFDG